MSHASTVTSFLLPWTQQHPQEGAAPWAWFPEYSQRWPTVCIYMRNKPLPRFLLRLWDWYHSITRQNCLPRAELRPTWNYYHEYTVTAYCHGCGFITSHIHLHRGRQSIFVELDLNRVVSHQIVQKEVRNWQGICKCYKEVLIIINHEI